MLAREDVHVCQAHRGAPVSALTFFVRLLPADSQASGGAHVHALAKGLGTEHGLIGIDVLDREAALGQRGEGHLRASGRLKRQRRVPRAAQRELGVAIVAHRGRHARGERSRLQRPLATARVHHGESLHAARVRAGGALHGELGHRHAVDALQRGR